MKEPNPAKYLTAFDFYCSSFEELPEKMKNEVGYIVKPNDIWSIDIRSHELTKLHVTLVIIYWTEDKIAKRQAQDIERANQILKQ